LSVRFSVNRSAEACVTFAANDWRDVRLVGDQGNVGIHVGMNIDNVVDGNLRPSDERIPSLARTGPHKNRPHYRFGRPAPISAISSTSTMMPVNGTPATRK